MSGFEMAIAGIAAVNTLIAGGIWFRIGHLEGQNEGMEDRQRTMLKRVERLENHVMKVTP